MYLAVGGFITGWIEISFTTCTQRHILELVTRAVTRCGPEMKKDAKLKQG